MTERIRVENVDELKRLSAKLDSLRGELDLNVLADSAGEVEQALDRILGDLDKVFELVGFTGDDPQSRRTREEVELFLRTSQGALAGFERGALLSQAFFRRSPAVRAAFTLLGTALGTYMGFTEQERQAEVARQQLIIDTLRRSDDLSFRRLQERQEKARAARLQAAQQ